MVFTGQLILYVTIISKFDMAIFNSKTRETVWIKIRKFSLKTYIIIKNQISYSYSFTDLYRSGTNLHSFQTILQTYATAMKFELGSLSFIIVIVVIVSLSIGSLHRNVWTQNQVAPIYKRRRNIYSVRVQMFLPTVRRGRDGKDFVRGFINQTSPFPSPASSPNPFRESLGTVPSYRSHNTAPLLYILHGVASVRIFLPSRNGYRTIICNSDFLSEIHTRPVKPGLAPHKVDNALDLV